MMDNTTILFIPMVIGLIAATRVFLMRVNRRNASFRLRQHLYLALARCNTGMTVRSSTADLFEAICTALASVPNIKLVFIGVSDGDHAIHPVCARGSCLGYLDGMVLSSDAARSEGRGAMGQSIRSGAPIWVNDYLRDEITGPWRQTGRKFGFRGSACLPIITQGILQCVISIYTDTVGYFDLDTRPLLMEFAAQLGLALEARAAEQSAASSAQAAKRATAEAALANERLGAIIRASSDLICSLDRDGKIVAVSDGRPDAVAGSQERLLGRNCLDFIAADSRSYCVIREALQRIDDPSLSHTLNVTFTRQSGKQTPMSLTVVWSPDQQLFHCIARDLTEFKALEDTARHTQRLESIGVLTGGIAHDFNNMLAVIIVNGEYLQESLTDPLHRELANLVLQTAERGANLTQQLLAFARRQPLVPEPCDLGELVHAALPLLRQALVPLSLLEVSASPHVPPTLLDPTQFIQVLMNLCLNARDAMPNGGKVTIAIDTIDKLGPAFKARTQNIPDTHVAVCVTDTGQGIAPGDIERIFEPFFTTKGPGRGSGLGLCMAYGFVTQSGGWIDVSSQPGRGTTFVLTFPPHLHTVS